MRRQKLSYILFRKGRRWANNKLRIFNGIADVFSNKMNLKDLLPCMIQEGQVPFFGSGGKIIITTLPPADFVPRFGEIRSRGVGSISTT